MGKRRLRKEVEEAMRERDVLRGKMDEAIEKVDRIVRPFLEEYDVVNGTFKEDNERKDANES